MLTRRPTVPSRRRTVPRRVNIYFIFRYRGSMLGSTPNERRRTKQCSFFKHHDSQVLNRKLYTDFEWFLKLFNIHLIFDTEISPCVRFFDQKWAAISSQANFQKNGSPSRETALDEKKCSFPRVRINFFENLLGNLLQHVFNRKIERMAKIQYRR